MLIMLVCPEESAAQHSTAHVASQPKMVGVTMLLMLLSIQ
jgi:hypothetical protein